MNRDAGVGRVQRQRVSLTNGRSQNKGTRKFRACEREVAINGVDEERPAAAGFKQDLENKKSEASGRTDIPP